MPTEASLISIQNLYIVYLGRPADPAGLTYWATQLDNAGGNLLAAVLSGFSESPEFAARLADNPTPTDLVNSLYADLFGRPADQAGLTFWLTALENGDISASELPEVLRTGAQGEDAEVLSAKTDLANAFTAQLTNTETAFSGDSAVAVSQAFLSKLTVDTLAELANIEADMSLYIEATGNATANPELYQGLSPEQIIAAIENPVPALPETALFEASGLTSGTSDASTAVAIDEQFMIVGDDEGNVLRVFDRSGGEPLVEWDFSEFLGIGGDELDTEASALIGNKLYVMGSHSNDKGGDPEANREFIFTVEINGTGADTTFTYHNSYNGLEQDLIAWDNADSHGLGAGYFDFAVAVAEGSIPEQVSGFSMEGMTFSQDNSELWLAFRTPLTDTQSRDQALIVPVTNFESLLAGDDAEAVFGDPLELNLGGRGIRSIEKADDGSGYLIIAGANGNNTDALVHNFRLFSWSGEAEDEPVELNTDLDALRVETGGSFESIVAVNSLQAGTKVQLLQDNGDTIFPGESEIGKDLPEADQRFIGNVVELGEPVIDNMGPQLKQTLPADEANGVAVDGDITLIFNEGIEAGNGNINIHNAAGEIVQSFSVNDGSQVQFGFNSVSVTPEPLAFESDYYITVDASAIADHYGNNFAGFNDPQTLNFNTSGQPTVLEINDLLFMAGNAESPDGFAFIVLKNINGGTDITFTDRDYSETTGFDGITNEFAFQWRADQDYPAGTVITIQTDVEGNPIADKGTTLGEAGGIGKAETIYALQGTEFESLATGSAGIISNAGQFLASLTLGGPASFIPQELLDANTAFSFTVDPENQTNALYSGLLDTTDLVALAESIKNLDNRQANFTKAPGFPLTNDSFFGAPILVNATVEAQTITLNWNQALDTGNPPAAGSFNIEINEQAVTINTVTVTGNQVLLAIDTEVVGGDIVTMNYQDPTTGDDAAAIQFQNGSDAASVQDQLVMNMAADNQAPTLQTTSPADEQQAVAPGEPLILTFDEIIEAGMGNITFTGLDGAEDIIIDVNSDVVTIENNVVSIQPPRLNELAQYAVQIDAGAFVDVAGNAFAGIADNETLNFTTEATAEYSLLISELNSDSTGGDFFELFNYGDESISLDGWKWTDNQAQFLGDKAVTFAASHQIAAGQSVLVIAGDEADIAEFRTAWNLDESQEIIAIGGPGLGKGDSVVVFDENGNVATALNYGLEAITASDGVVIEGIGIDQGDDTEHTGFALGGDSEGASAVWDSISTDNPNYLAAAADGDDFGSMAQNGDANSIGSPGTVIAGGPNYDLLISEINSNATGGDFFELYNYGDESISLDGWKWTDSQADVNGDKAVTFGSDMQIAAGQSVVIIAEAESEIAAFRAEWDLDESTTVYAIGGPGLGKGDSVVVFDDNGLVATGLNYGIDPITASDGSIIEAIGQSGDEEHTGVATGGNIEPASAIWDGVSFENPNYLAATDADDFGSQAQSNDADSIGSPGLVILGSESMDIMI